MMEMRMAKAERTTSSLDHKCHRCSCSIPAGETFTVVHEHMVKSMGLSRSREGSWISKRFCLMCRTNRGK